MLLHIIFAWVDLIQTQRFKNQLENEFGNYSRKRKAKFHFSFSLPHFWPAGPFFSTGLPDFLFLPSFFFRSRPSPIPTPLFLLHLAEPA
jgi:hypothetical protein